MIKKKKEKETKMEETCPGLVKYNRLCGKSDLLDFRLQKKEVHTQS